MAKTYGPTGACTGEIVDMGGGKQVIYNEVGRRVGETKDWGTHTSIYNEVGRKVGEIWP